MRKLSVSMIAILALAPSAPLFAQQYGRPQDGFVSGQYSGQYFGRYSGRVDGRVSRNEGFPPSAADKYFQTYAVPTPVDPMDCIEVDSFAPDARPYWQARIRYACR